MTLARLFLIYAVLMLAGFGVLSLLNPQALARMVGMQLTTTTAISDVRAVYGGLEIALALFLVWCLLDASRMSLGLGFTAAAFGFVAAGRGLGVLLDRPVTSLTLKVLAVEAATALVAWLLWSRTS